MMHDDVSRVLTGMDVRQNQSEHKPTMVACGDLGKSLHAVVTKIIDNMIPQKSNYFVR